MLTLKMMMCSTRTLVVGDELTVANPGNLLQGEKLKLTSSRAPLDACLLPCGLRTEAHLLDHKSYAGVVLIGG
jgi:hypothetical protein